MIADRTKTVRVRRERPEDERRVEEITRDAFWNLYVPGCVEHLLVHRIRRHRDFIPELSFVIERNGAVAGGIFYTASKVRSPDGREHDTVTFGPVSIAPQLHRQGLGRALITRSIDEARRLGRRAILILGYPYHYEPYGFVGAKRWGIAMPDGRYYRGFMALPLFDGALDGMAGTVVFSDVYDVDPADAEAFDRGFPPKEKKFQESQRAFERAAQELDE